MRIGIIGTGNMGTILTQAFIDAKAIPENKMSINNRTIKKALQLKAQYPNIDVKTKVEDLVRASDLIFLCVKPLDIYPLLIKVKHLLTKDKCLISITSPVKVKQLETIVECSCVRFIPSITNRAMAGVCLVTYGSSCSVEWKEKINRLLSYIGKPIEIEDETVRAASDIVSCGPAFFSNLIQKFIEAAVKETKISKEVATKLAAEMLVGMGSLIEKDYYTLSTLQEKVSVKGGVTGEGIKVLEESEIRETFQEIFKKTHEKFAQDVEHVTNQFEMYKV